MPELLDCELLEWGIREFHREFDTNPLSIGLIVCDGKKVGVIRFHPAPDGWWNAHSDKELSDLLLELAETCNTFVIFSDIQGPEEGFSISWKSSEDLTPARIDVLRDIYQEHLDAARTMN